MSLTKIIMNNCSSIPVHLNFRSGKVKWLKLDGYSNFVFLDSQIITSLEQHTFETDLDHLLVHTKEMFPNQPSGFIFHTSRCGSTLVSRVLQKNKDVLVLNEPQPINALLVAFSSNHVIDEQREEAEDRMLKNVIAAYTNTGLRIFIKFSSFNLLLIKRIQKKWKDVPMLFLYRNPLDIVVSNLERNGGFIRKRNHPYLANMLNQCDIELKKYISEEEFCIRMTNTFFQMIIDHLKNNSSYHDNMMLTDYEDLNPDSIMDVMRFFGITPAPVFKNEILDCLNSHSKKGGAFIKDTISKRERASSIVRDLCMNLAFENYQKLKKYESVLEYHKRHSNNSKILLHKCSSCSSTLPHRN